MGAFAKGASRRMDLPTPPPADLSGWTVVFDLDGTLVDTAPDLIGALNGVLAERDLPQLPVAAARMLVGRGARTLIRHGFQAAGEALDEAEVEPLTARFLELYRSRIARESRPFPGVVQALDGLAARGAALSVCTNKVSDLSRLLLDALGLTGRFASVVGADQPSVCKPDPSHYRMAVEEAGGEAARSIMVGDSINDVLSAHAAGAPVVLVSFGYTEEPASTLGAERLIDHFDQLAAAVDGLVGAALPARAPSSIGSCS